MVFSGPVTSPLPSSPEMQSDSSHYWFMFVQTRAIHKDPEPLRISGAVVLMGDLNLISVLVSCLF